MLRSISAVSLGLAAGLGAKNPLRHPTDALELRFALSQPIVHYTLRVNARDLSGFDVEMHVRNAPDTFRLAMVRHPEYDDRFWRYVQNARVDGGAITRVDSAVWRVTLRGGEGTVSYHIGLPTPLRTEARDAWVPFLRPTGALVGGPHSFMYIVGANLAPVHVQFDVPAGWDIATGLTPTSDARTFFAPSIDDLVDSPALVGRFSSWRFDVDGVPHRVVYWPLPDAQAFDSVALVNAIAGVTRQAVLLFGRAPWREYTFILQDGAVGALEHANSVTIGAPSADLAQGVNPIMGEIAHEFFHAWNLVRIHPSEFRPVDFRTPEPSAGLWFSEGFSMFYSDVLRRRAGIPTEDSTRTTHVEGLIARYLSAPGPARLPAERVSRAANNSEPGALGDYSASTHLQGELIGTVLDLVVRDATGNRHSMDDVMRMMLARFSAARGFTSRDVEHVVNEVCGCNVTPFFDAHVVGATGPIDFDRYLRLGGMRLVVTRSTALGRDGAPAPDQRVRAFFHEADSTMRVWIFDPGSAWGRAGLHTGDQLMAVNGGRIATLSQFRDMLGRVRVGDTLRVAVRRQNGPFTATVVIAPFDRPYVRIEQIEHPTPRQRAIRDAWMTAR